MQVERPVEQARAGEPGAVALERIARALHDARIGGEAEVVVRAEHDPLGALHLDHRRGRRFERPEVRQQVGLAGGAELLGALVAPYLAEHVDGRRHVLCPPPWGRSRSGRCILRATSVVSSGSRSGSIATSPTGSRRCSSSASSSWTGARTRSSSTAAPSTSSRSATGGPSAASRAGRRQLPGLPGEPLGLVRLLRVRGGPGGGQGAARPRRAVAARAELRPHGGPRGLHHQRRVRRAARGPRAHAADPLAVDAPLLPGAARGRRHGQGDGPAHVGAAHHRARQGQPRDLEARRPGRGAPRRGRAPVPQARHRGGGEPVHRGLPRGLGEELGLRAADREARSATTPRSSSRSWTRTGPTWPRRTARRSARR